MNKLKWLPVAMLTVTALAGCSGSGNETGGETINFMVYQPSDQNDQEALQALMDDFKEETGYTVRLQTVVKDSYDATFRSAITRGKYKPDLAYLDQPLIATYASDNLITELNDYIEEEGIDVTKYNQAAFSTNVYNGKTYGLPLNVTASVLFYNKDLVKEEDIPSTWEEWLAVNVPSGKALFEGIGTEGYAGWYFQAFLENCGGHLYDQATGTVAFNSPQGIEAASFIKQLYRFDKDDQNIRAGANAFLNGDIVFKIGSSFDIDNLLKQNPNFNLGATLMPGKDGTTHYSCMGGENLVIPSSAGNKEGAKELLSFLNRKENMSLLSSFTGNFPAITEYQQTDDPIKAVVIEQLQSVVARPIVPGWMQVNDLYLGAALDDILDYEQEADIEERLAWAEEASNAVLAK